jgi:hypothetical protein
MKKQTLDQETTNYIDDIICNKKKPDNEFEKIIIPVLLNNISNLEKTKSEIQNLQNKIISFDGAINTLISLLIQQKNKKE